MTIHNKQWHNFAASEARALGDIISESTGSIISECPGDFIGIRIQCEYNRDELSDELFFDLYYHELSKDDPVAAPAVDRDRHIASLAEVVATLVNIRNVLRCALC